MVSAVLSDAKRNEIIEKNPARMLDLPTPQRTVQRIPTRSEVEKLLDALAKEPRHYRLFYLLSMYTGCRRGELCALKWSDFSCTKNGLLLTVSRSRSSVPGKGIVEGSTKNGKSREVYLSSDLRGILLAYKRRKQMEADKQRRKLSPYLFTDEQGQLIHPDTFTKRLRKIYAAIGFPREYHLHTLRHPYVKHTTKIFSLRLMDFQAQAYPDARRKTRGACQLHRGGQSQSPVRPLCNRKQFS